MKPANGSGTDSEIPRNVPKILSQVCVHGSEVPLEIVPFQVILDGSSQRSCGGDVAY